MSMYSLCSLHWTHILTPSSKKVETGQHLLGAPRHLVGKVLGLGQHLGLPGGHGGGGGAAGGCDVVSTDDTLARTPETE